MGVVFFRSTQYLGTAAEINVPPIRVSKVQRLKLFPEVEDPIVFLSPRIRGERINFYATVTSLSSR